MTILSSIEATRASELRAVVGWALERLDLNSRLKSVELEVIDGDFTCSVDWSGPSRDAVKVCILSHLVGPPLRSAILHELTHPRDELDPTFGIPSGFTTKTLPWITGERYMCVWNIDSRCESLLGHPGYADRAARETEWRFWTMEFVQPFNELTFEKLWATPVTTHEEMVRIARDPRCLLTQGNLDSRNRLVKPLRTFKGDLDCRAYWAHRQSNRAALAIPYAVRAILDGDDRQVAVEFRTQASCRALVEILNGDSAESEVLGSRNDNVENPGRAVVMVPIGKGAQRLIARTTLVDEHGITVSEKRPVRRSFGARRNPS